MRGSILKALPPLSGIACLLSQGSLTVFNFFVTVHPYEAKSNKCEDNNKPLNMIIIIMLLIIILKSYFFPEIF